MDNNNNNRMKPDDDSLLTSIISIISIIFCNHLVQNLTVFSVPSNQWVKAAYLRAT